MMLIGLEFFKFSLYIPRFLAGIGRKNIQELLHFSQNLRRLVGMVEIAARFKLILKQFASEITNGIPASQDEGNYF